MKAFAVYKEVDAKIGLSYSARKLLACDCSRYVANLFIGGIET
jgi:hypothetical protein